MPLTRCQFFAAVCHVTLQSAAPRICAACAICGARCRAYLRRGRCAGNAAVRAYALIYKRVRNGAMQCYEEEAPHARAAPLDTDGQYQRCYATLMITPAC